MKKAAWFRNMRSDVSENDAKTKMKRNQNEIDC